MGKGNYLTVDKVFALGNFLQTQEERLKTEGPTFETVAGWAVKALGFPVSAQNVETVSKGSRVTWEVKVRRASKAGRKLRADLEAAVGRLAQLEQGWSQLRDEVTQKNYLAGSVAQAGNRIEELEGHVMRTMKALNQA